MSVNGGGLTGTVRIGRWLSRGPVYQRCGGGQGVGDVQVVGQRLGEVHRMAGSADMAVAQAILAARAARIRVRAASATRPFGGPLLAERPRAFLRVVRREDLAL